MTWFHSTPESEAELAEERLVLSATEAVEEAMARAGKNRQQLAELLNVQPTEVSQRLSGRRNLTLRTLARMLHVLGMRAELTLESALPAVGAKEDAAPIAAEPLDYSNVLFIAPREARSYSIHPSDWGTGEESATPAWWRAGNTTAAQ